jgi:predicted nucleic acid-binding protein
MFANRYTALIDACSLADSLRRDLLLTLAEAEFFRVRWSNPILAETERAIARIAASRGDADAADRGARACAVMIRAFPEASVEEFDHLLATAASMTDPDDRHVLAAAMKTQAQTIVTENLRDFPADILEPWRSRVDEFSLVGMHLGNLPACEPAGCQEDVKTPVAALHGPATCRKGTRVSASALQVGWPACEQSDLILDHSGPALHAIGKVGVRIVGPHVLRLIGAHRTGRVCRVLEVVGDGGVRIAGHILKVVGGAFCIGLDVIRGLLPGAAVARRKGDQADCGAESKDLLHGITPVVNS